MHGKDRRTCAFHHHWTSPLGYTQAIHCIISLLASLYTHTKDFCLILCHDPKATTRQYKSVYPALRPVALGLCQPGAATSCLVQPGPKTRALFLKHQYMMHSRYYTEQSKIITFILDPNLLGPTLLPRAIYRQEYQVNWALPSQAVNIILSYILIIIK